VTDAKPSPRQRRLLEALLPHGLMMLCALLCSGAALARPPELAPDFSRPALSGEPVQLSAYRGEVVLLNYWASWCAPCIEELPLLSQWQRHYAPAGLRIIGVSMDDDVETVKRFLRKHPAPYPIIMGDAELGRSYGGVLGLPMSFLIDAWGRIVARYSGEIDPARVKAAIEVQLRRRAQVQTSG
jgi:cytochrome c biogenesis protein CcmG/thiol:disulfide interchange protein DsbE